MPMCHQTMLHLLATGYCSPRRVERGSKRAQPTESMPTIAATTTAPPAGGAAIGEVVIATAGALLLTTALVCAGLGAPDRAHRFPAPDRPSAAASSRAARRGRPCRPTIATASLLIAVFGMYWDISLHIGEGRDPGPLANPAHYFILAGLFGIFAAGFLAVVLPDERPSRAAIRIAGDWYAPLGGLVLLACAAFALLGFPLDDVWHRLFGQDVTLWGPTHLMLIGGAGLSLLGMAILMVEGGRQRAGTADGGARRPDHGAHVPHPLRGGCGGLLVGLSTFQAEFDFGVPQFRLLFQPVLIAFAAGVALVAARTYAGRGAALVALALLPRRPRRADAARRAGAGRADAVLPAVRGRGADAGIHGAVCVRRPAGAAADAQRQGGPQGPA